MRCWALRTFRTFAAEFLLHVVLVAEEVYAVDVLIKSGEEARESGGESMKQA